MNRAAPTRPDIHYPDSPIKGSVSPTQDTVQPAFGGVASHAAHYATLGFALVPIEPGLKGPRSSGWQDNPIITSQAAHSFWTSHPRHNMGLLHGSSDTATLDIDHEDGARLALAEIGADLDQLLEATVRIRGAKGEKPLYNALGLSLSRKALTWPHPSDPRGKVTILELRGGAGFQDVLPPSIHPIGIPYQWAGKVPSSRADLDDLPEVLIHLWHNWEEFLPQMVAACPWPDPRPVVAKHETRSSIPSPSPRAGESVIQAFNARYNAVELLERNGYIRMGDRWSAPTSESGMAGVVLLEGKVFSHHASDLLNDGHTHDAFSLLTLLEHGGDVRAAARAAAGELGLPQRGATPSSPGQPQSYRSRMYARLRGVI